MQAGEPTAGYPGAALFQSADWLCCVQAGEPTAGYPGAARLRDPQPPGEESLRKYQANISAAFFCGKNSIPMSAF